MNFDDLDTRMRRYETAHDHCVLPGLFIVARLDGRSFTRLTKEVHKFEAPFDERFRDLMIVTVRELFGSGVRVIYGYTQSDEISLLLHPDETLFDRKLRRYDSVLAGFTSAHFSLALGAVGVFDCRISQLPTVALVVDYFRWRAEDAHRNALNSHCYWLLRKQGVSARKADEQLLRKSNADKNELLHANGINFNSLPSWQKRGVGIYWKDYLKPGFNPKRGVDTAPATRRELYAELELPQRDAYSQFIMERLPQPDTDKKKK